MIIETADSMKTLISGVLVFRTFTWKAHRLRLSLTQILPMKCSLGVRFGSQQVHTITNIIMYCHRCCFITVMKTKKLHNQLHLHIM